MRVENLCDGLVQHRSAKQSGPRPTSLTMQSFSNDAVSSRSVPSRECAWLRRSPLLLRSFRNHECCPCSTPSLRSHLDREGSWVACLAHFSSSSAHVVLGRVVHIQSRECECECECEYTLEYARAINQLRPGALALAWCACQPA